MKKNPKAVCAELNRRASEIARVLGGRRVPLLHPAFAGSYANIKLREGGGISICWRRANRTYLIEGNWPISPRTGLPQYPASKGPVLIVPEDWPAQKIAAEIHRPNFMARYRRLYARAEDEACRIEKQLLPDSRRVTKTL